jgi:hypothetical protein
LACKPTMVHGKIPGIGLRLLDHSV